MCPAILCQFLLHLKCQVLQPAIIHSLNTRKIDSVETLRSAVRDLKSGAAVVLQIERDGGLQYLAFEME